MKILLAVSFLLFGTNVYASFIDLEWEYGSFGNTSITLDTTSNLEWLDVDVTTNQSDMQSLFSGTGIYSGFRYATQAEVMQLFTNAGLIEHDVCYSCADSAAIEDFFGHFGITYDWMDPFYLIGINGFINETTSGERNVATIELDYGGDDAPYTFVSSSAWSLPSSSYDNVGHFLVRTSEVPIPGAIWLFLSGLGILASLTMRCSRHRR